MGAGEKNRPKAGRSDLPLPGVARAGTKGFRAIQLMENRCLDKNKKINSCNVIVLVVAVLSFVVFIRKTKYVFRVLTEFTP